MAADANALDNEHHETRRQSACVRLQNILTHGSAQAEQKVKESPSSWMKQTMIAYIPNTPKGFLNVHLSRADSA